MSNIVAKTEYSFASLTPKQVYGAWLDPEQVREWMTRNMKARGGDYEVTRIEIDPVIGGHYLFAGKQDGEQSDSWGYYRELEPGRRLVFTWFVDEDEERENNSTVTLELTADGQGTRASMSHEMDAQWEPYADQTAAAWHGMLKAIDQILTDPAE